MTARAGYDAVEEILSQGQSPHGHCLLQRYGRPGGDAWIAQPGEIEPGKDIAVTGYDDIEEASISSPPLTTVGRRT